MAFQSLPGFRDFFPAEHAARRHIQLAWRIAAQRYAFEEYDGPPLEPLELYVAKSGEEIVDQLYAFEDKGGRNVALRPEMTPTLARMVGEHGRSLPKPIRWFSMPQLFRYERTQRARLREQFQWNVDIIGEEDIAADAEVLSVALDGLALLGLGAGDVVARVNDRRLLEALLLGTGVPRESLGGAYAAIDKMSREDAERTRARLKEGAGLGDEVVGRVMPLFDLDLAGLRARHGGDPAVSAELDRLNRERQALETEMLAAARGEKQAAAAAPAPKAKEKPAPRPAAAWAVSRRTSPARSPPPRARDSAAPCATSSSSTSTRPAPAPRIT